MISAILQARQSSSRLPGKVLKPILGMPMLLRQVERIKRSEMIDEICVATTTEVSDDELVNVCKQYGLRVFRGSLTDVLKRFSQAADSLNTDHIVRLTGDCPLADPEVIDDTIHFYLDGEYDFVSNGIEPTFPDGLDVAIFKTSVLKIADDEAELMSEREHVTPFIRKSDHRFKVGSFTQSVDYSSMRWTVDEPEDFQFVCAVYENLYSKKPDFSSSDIYQLLQIKPELLSLNSMYSRNEGLMKSLEAEKQDK